MSQRELDKHEQRDADLRKALQMRDAMKLADTGDGEVMRALAFDQTKCPKCGQIAVADFVDNGVGMEQSGPFGCEACGWVEERPQGLIDEEGDDFS